MQRGAFPSNEKSAKRIVPRVGSFNDPPSRLSTNAAEECVLTAAANVRSNLTSTNRFLDVSVVVSLVETQVLRSPRAACSTQCNGIENRGRHPFVMHVGRGNLQRNRDTPTIFVFPSGNGTVSNRERWFCDTPEALAWLRDPHTLGVNE